MSRILVTGADGFVGRALVDFLRGEGDSIVACVRRAEAIDGARVVRIPDIRTAEWDHALPGVDAVIHLAARAHILRERHANPIAEFRAVNVDPTVALFRACQAAGVERFIFVSSIGVNGRSSEGRPFTECDTARPAEPYAISKWQAEESLRAHLIRDSTRLIVVRPTLIYGPHAKGNFLRLMRWIDAGWPIPLGAVSAKRTFLGLTPFCDMLRKCASIAFADEQLFVVGDDKPVSTRELISALAAAMNVKARQPRLPVKLLSLVARSMNRGAEFERLSNALEVDSSRAKTILGWTSPALGPDLERMADNYLRTKQ